MQPLPRFCTHRSNLPPFLLRPPAYTPLRTAVRAARTVRLLYVSSRLPMRIPIPSSVPPHAADPKRMLPLRKAGQGVRGTANTLTGEYAEERPDWRREASPGPSAEQTPRQKGGACVFQRRTRATPPTRNHPTCRPRRP